MRSIAPPFVVAPPAGARIRTRLRLTQADEAVVSAVGNHLGRLASSDLAWRCRLGRQDDLRTIRKRALTGLSSSRWAGTITRISDDQWQRAMANLADRRIALRRAIRTIRSRLVVPVGSKQGRVRGYANRSELFAKRRRLQHLEAELVELEDRLARTRVTVCRGGRRLAKGRHALDQAKVSEQQWRARWKAERMFLTADGEAAKSWGNETIRVHPDQHWLELRLPNPLAHLSNTPGRAATYRLACPVHFAHRSDEWAVQAATGAVRYDVTFDPVRARWYLSASWRRPAVQPPPLDDLRRHRALGIDLNADHLACWVLDAAGNPIGLPHTIPLQLDNLPAGARDGHTRAAITAVLGLARLAGCRSLVVENLDFAIAREIGRETLGRGRQGKRFRRTVAGLPTRRFRELLVGMAANHQLWVIAVDPGWTSRWGQRYWRAPLARSTKSYVIVTRHHAAAVVIARRGLGVGARRRRGVPGDDQRIVAGELPARPSRRRLGPQGPAPPEGQRAAAAPRRTRPAEWSRLGDQVVQDRSEPPWQDKVLRTWQER
jgi:hypothetical protein